MDDDFVPPSELTRDRRQTADSLPFSDRSRTTVELQRWQWEATLHILNTPARVLADDGSIERRLFADQIHRISRLVEQQLDTRERQPEESSFDG